MTARQKVSVGEALHWEARGKEKDAQKGAEGPFSRNLLGEGRMRWRETRDPEYWKGSLS